MAVDENGYICTLKKQPIPARYQELLTSVQSQLLAQYGDRICSIFIYGSVARGKATPPKSDLDLCVIFHGNIDNTEALALSKIGENSLRLYPIVPKVDFDIASQQEVLSPNNTNSWGYWLKHHCRIIYGDDLSRDFPLFRPSRAIALAVNGDYHTTLLDYIQKMASTDDQATFLKLSKEASKKLIRSTNILRTPNDTDWPDTLDEHITRLHNKYPALAHQLPFFMAQIQFATYSKKDFIPHLHTAITRLLQADESMKANEKA
ncbi:nucleotidyltransferase domain-containing protein [Providencia stuartii]|uniref:nucleotidyltransferase domain-containing protein n=1 Tax=Providencia stuartii TaxID=588 RepID=UPI0013D4B5F2|nr:nucleotidyltransferase domain-containing protein [Providencia stuartii]